MHPAKKTTGAPPARKGRALKEVEREWLQSVKPTPEQRKDLALSNSERAEARLRDVLAVEFLAGDPSSEALKSVDRRRREALENERVRERGRRRPDKHLPSGLEAVSFLSSGAAGIQTTLIPAGASVMAYEYLTDDLRSDAEVLRAIWNFDGAEIVIVDPAAPPTLRNGRRVVEVGRGGSRIRREFADALRLAAAEARRVWVTIALELVTDALRERQIRSRKLEEAARLDRPLGIPRPATTEDGVFAGLRGYMAHLGLPLPSYADRAAIAWMLSHLAIGSRRGGGRSGKLGADAMRKVLADPEKLADAMRKVLADPEKLARAMAGPNSKRKRR